MTLRLAILLAAPIFGFIGTLTALRVSNEPYLWIFPCWCAACMLVAFANKTPVAKAIWTNVAVAAITLGAVEGYWSFHRHQDTNGHYAGSYTDQYFLKHEYLGHAPAKDTRATSARIYQDEILYDVEYTIDRHGLRISPPHQDDASDCLLFFGGSFTFGEGVSDEEAMPYRVGILSAGKYRVYNFGFHAYGAHQMLSALQHGLVEQVIECNPKYVIYLGMGAHIARSAGSVPWEHHGPWYALEPDGRVRYAGHFDEKPENKLAARFRLDTSQIYQRLIGKQRAITRYDMELYIAIITTARDTLLKNYPESKFHVLLWGLDNDEMFQYLLETLEKRKINTHPLSRIIPSYSLSPNQYEISPYDDHPNALSHDLVARYIINNILDE